MEGLTFNVLLASAGVALVHVLAGPDHIVPFVMLARAQQWGALKTFWVTVLCGVGHVMSSVLLGLVGLAIGAGLGQVSFLEEVRGSIAAWGLVAFGVAYAVWGTRRAVVEGKRLALHSHDHHVHIHAHGGDPHAHAHGPGSPLTFWSLFLIFAFGPCEPLIPLFMMPASRGRWDIALASGAVFSVITLVTMVVAVLVLRAGVLRVPFFRWERWSHSLAGSVIAVSGLAVLVFGL